MMCSSSKSVFERVTGRAAGSEISSESCGLAAQQLRQAAEQYAKAGQYEMSGEALVVKASLHERQQLPDAQVAALLAAAEQYRTVGTKQMLANAQMTLDNALDLRLAQAREGERICPKRDSIAAAAGTGWGTE